MTYQQSESEPMTLHEGSPQDYALCVTKGTIDLIRNHIAEMRDKGDSVSNNLSNDAILLYVQYAYTSKWQKSHQCKCTTSYAANSLEWTDERVRRAKNVLKEIGLVTDIVKKDESGKVNGHYIRLRFYMSSDTQANDATTLPSNRGGGLDQGVDEVGDKCSREIKKCSRDIEKCSREDIPPNKPDSGLPPIPYDEILAEWNSTPLPRIERLTRERKEKIRSRWKDHYFRENWKTAIKTAGASEFLCGGGRPKNPGEKPFVMDIGWFLKNDTNFTKIMEGKYGEVKKEAKRLTKEEFEAECRKRGWNPEEVGNY